MSENDKEIEGVDPPENPADLTKKPQRSPMAGVVDLVTLLWSGFIFLFGATFTCRLILNLLGYGYRFSPTDGRRIDTLDELRMEKQLQRSDSVEPARPGGINEFFLRNPFTASLLVTGGVLAYESVVSDKKKSNK